MHNRRGDEEHGPLKTCNLVDDDALRILLVEYLLRFLGCVDRESGEGRDCQEVEGPGERRKDQVQRYGDDRSRRPGSEGDEPAPETGGNDLDEFTQKSPLSRRRNLTFFGGKPIFFSLSCQWR